MGAEQSNEASQENLQGSSNRTVGLNGSAPCPHAANITGTATGKCPFLHGTVHAAPFPGYVHGRNPAICHHGCAPSLNVEAGETVTETLLREAKEFQALFHHEKGNSEEAEQERWAEIVAEVEKTGTYTHTFDELEHGIRVAWRNAPKCANRKFWNEIKLLDKRHVKTNKEMFDACLDHLELAMKNGVTEAYMTCFRPAVPGSTQGPRVWNDQLYSYAGYRNDDMELVGDPAKALFTDMLRRRFGWVGPSGGKGEWDHLPLVMQVDPTQPPEMFEIPETYWQDVRIWHPDYPFLSKLGLRWYPVPAVCALQMTVGGILYTGIPFNGWYADTEVVRDLTDEGRYNLLPKVARMMGLDATQEMSLWKDEVQVVINKAVLHSFAHNNVAMVDHHTLISGFYDWYRQELTLRGYCPGNWKWVIPPQASALSKAYLKLNKMTEYCLKPAYLYAPSWQKLEQATYGEGDAHRARVQKHLGVLVWSTRVVGRALRAMQNKRLCVLVVYASVSGKTRVFAGRLAALLHDSACKVEVMDAAAFSPSRATKFTQILTRAHVLLLLTSTYGNGQVPFSAMPLLEYLEGFSGESKPGTQRPVLPPKAAQFLKNASVHHHRSFSKHSLGGRGGMSNEELALFRKPFAVLGFGSSNYPKFCGGAEKMSSALAGAGATPLLPIGKCDAQVGETATFHEWLLAVAEKVSVVNRAQALDVDAIRARTASGPSVLPVTLQVLSDEAAREFAMERMLHGHGESAEVGDHGTHEMSTKVTHHSSIEGYVAHNTPLLPGTTTLEGAERMTSLIKIDLSKGAAPPYHPGDHLLVIPRNVISHEQLERFCANVDVLPDRVIIPSLEEEDERRRMRPEKFPLLAALIHKPTTCTDLLTLYAGALSNVDAVACQVLRQLLKEEADQDEAFKRAPSASYTELTRIASDPAAHSAFVREQGLRWIDVFERFPDLKGKLTLPMLLCLMPLNHPRFYSIASSSLCNPDSVDICVGRLVYTLPNGEPRKGVASDFLTLARPGTEVNFNIHTVRSFHLPMDPKAPLLLLGAGTGIAPFRGFWQHRLALKRRGIELGPCMMLWGCRSSSERLLQKEVEEAVREGALSEVLVALSREPGQPKEYVQDVVRREKNKVAALLADTSAHVYICGESRMAIDVEAALEAAAGEETLKALKGERRLHEDVFGIGDNSIAKPNSSG